MADCRSTRTSRSPTCSARDSDKCRPYRMQAFGLAGRTVDSMKRIEIIPGTGTALVKVGDSRSDVEAVLGLPAHPGVPQDTCVYGEDARYVVHYAGDTVEMVELGYGGTGAEEIFLGDIQLTARLMEDVVADLEAAGHVGTESDIGYEYATGFAIFSMHSISMADLEEESEEDDDVPDEDYDEEEYDERPVVEGVSLMRVGYYDA